MFLPEEFYINNRAIQANLTLVRELLINFQCDANDFVCVIELVDSLLRQFEVFAIKFKDNNDGIIDFYSVMLEQLKQQYRMLSAVFDNSNNDGIILLRGMLIAKINNAMNNNIKILEFMLDLYSAIYMLPSVWQNEIDNLKAIASNSPTIQYVDFACYPNTPLLLLLNALRCNNNVKHLKIHNVNKDEFKCIQKFLSTHATIKTADISEWSNKSVGLTPLFNYTMQSQDNQHEPIQRLGYPDFSCSPRLKDI